MQTRSKWIIGAFLLGVCLAFGAAMAQTLPRPVAELVARARAQVRAIDMAEFKSMLDGKGDVGLVIDVREPGEFASGHVPKAINIPRGQIELAIWPLVGFPAEPDMARRITLYCGSGIRCLLAAKSLQDLGFSNVVAVDMKIGDWARAGYPLVRE